MTDPAEMVANRQWVRARNAVDGVYGEGRVIAWTDRPVYTIERPNGTTFTWLAELCEPAEPTTTSAECINAALDLIDGYSAAFDDTVIFAAIRSALTGEVTECER